MNEYTHGYARDYDHEHTHEYCDWFVWINELTVLPIGSVWYSQYGACYNNSDGM